MKEEHKIVRQILAAQKSSEAADELIRQYLPFIKAETAKFIKRAPQEGKDDELGIAMLAFYEAAMSYQPGKGGFISLAATAIRNRLIDYYRKEQRHTGLVSLEGTPVGEDDSCLMDHLASGEDEIAAMHDRSATREEILEFSNQLKEFGLSLSDIADNCPKQERTMEICMQALEYAKARPELLELMVQSKRLPMAKLCEGIRGSRKTLERHRKYLVAILLAYTNGYEIIRGHLSRRGGKEGEEK